MGNTVKNLSVVLGVVTIAFGGFYLYTQYSGSGKDFYVGDQITQNMLNNTKIFIERGDILNRTTLDINFFEDDRFNSLRNYSTPIDEQPVGRKDPFADVN